MALSVLSSDQAGAIYSVDSVGDLFRNQQRNPDGTGPLIEPGFGAKVGTGWDKVMPLGVSRLQDAVVLAGIQYGAVLATATTSVGNVTRVQSPKPLEVGGTDGGEFTPVQLFGGPEGQFYLISNTGAFGRLKVTVDATTSEVSAKPIEIIDAEGWGGAIALFVNDDGVWFDITAAGNLRFQIVAGKEKAPNRDGWKPIATAWSRNQVVCAGGAGKIYVVASEGAFEVQRYTLGSDGTITLEPRLSTDVIGSGMLPWYGLAADIEGYCWPMSVCPGQQVDFMVGVRQSIPVPGVPMEVTEPVTYSVQFRRLHRQKDGKEGIYDEILATSFDGESFTAARYELTEDWLEKGAGWKTSFSFTVPDEWKSGVYTARCTDRNGRDYCISFVVRPKAPVNRLAVIANTNTWNAYNSWGGQGKYTHSRPVPENLPFRRPNPGLTPDVMHPEAMKGDALFGISIHNSSCHLLRAELWALGWLEDLGPDYAVDHYTDQDLHDGRTGIGDGDAPNYKALILNVHPEYWTREMYDRVLSFRDQGGSIVYLGGNGIYEAVTLSEDGAHMGIFPGVDRDKWPCGASNEQIRLHCLMRNPSNNRPEHALIGVGFQDCPGVGVDGQPYVLWQEPGAPGANPVLDGVPLHVGDKLGECSIEPDLEAKNPHTTHHASGWEVDARGNGTPPQAYDPSALLAIGTSGAPSGQMLAYETEAGGQVFAGASLNFVGSLVVDSNLQVIVKNVLDRCLKT